MPTSMLYLVIEEEDNPFLEADIRMEVQSLIEKTVPTDGRCNSDEYLNK